MVNKRSNRKEDTTTIGSAFKNLLSAYDMEDRYKEKQLIASWNKIMGHPIAVRTDKLYVKNKVLYVHLNSAPLKSELTYSKSKVIEVLVREIGENVITDVVFL